MIDKLREWKRRVREVLCPHAMTGKIVAHQPNSPLGTAGLASLKIECLDCGATMHQIIGAPGSGTHIPHYGLHDRRAGFFASLFGF